MGKLPELPAFHAFKLLRSVAMAGAVAVGLWLAAPSQALAFKLFGMSFFESEKEEPSPDAQPYSLDLKVNSTDSAVTDAVESASLLYTNKDDKPPPTTPAFLSRAEAEYGRIVGALYTEGYYGGVVTITVDGRPVEAIPKDATLARPARVAIAVDPGPRFSFGEVSVSGQPANLPTGDAKHPTPTELGLAPGAVARSAVVLQSEEAIVEEWRRRGHPKAANTPRDVVADHPSEKLNVAISVDPGPSAVYGPVTVSGMQRMDPEFVARQSGLVPGETFNSDDIERAQARLRHLGVFSSARVVEGDRVTPDGTLPLGIDVAEQPLHVFGAGASYSTTDGAGVDGYWEHRDLFGHAEHLRFDARVAGIDSADPRDFTYLAGVTFVRPGILDPMTDLKISLTAFREVYDPYTEDLARARIGLTHEFSDALSGSIALNGDYVRDDDAFGKRDFALFSIPAELTYDGTDDKLEPTKGWRAHVTVEPFQEFRYGNTGLDGRLDASAYYALDTAGRFVIAGRVALGSIVGPAGDEVPDGRLFFAGGGGSVRGYDYRSLGPRLANGDIVGGRSLFESSLELRVKVTDSIGIVPFVDAGSAFASSYPDFSGRMKVGAGLGLRYYTGLGAIRLDVAVPVNREHGDPRFALYIGLGEAF